MQTPFDAALRALDRDMDRLQSRIDAASAELNSMRTLHEAIAAAVVAEERVSAGEWQLFADTYLAGARAERARLQQLRSAAEVELTLVRRAAAERFAKLQAVGSAAEHYRSQAEQVFASAEQQMIDDVSAARFARMARARRRLP